MSDFVNTYPACKPLSRNEELDLVNKFRTGATGAERQAARHKLLASITPFAFRMAKGMKWTGLALDDLMQLAMMGADKGIQRFKPERGVKLLSYAVYWIRTSLQRGVSETAKTLRIPMLVWDLARKVHAAERRLLHMGTEPTAETIAAELTLPLYKVLWVLEGVHQRVHTLDPLPDDSPLRSRLNYSRSKTEELADPGAPDPVENIDTQKLNQALHRAVASLDTDERAVIERRFSENPMTLREISPTAVEWSKSRTALSRERVRQIEVQALGKLRRMLEHDPVISP